MDSKGKSETLKEQVAAIAQVPVASAVNNLQNEYVAIAKRLRAMPINIHGSVLNMLQTEFQLIQDETKNAIEEHKFQLAVKQREAEAAAQRKLEAEQAEIAEANKPKLVQPGAPAVQ
jgi:hypothetical protein